jgi:glycosyltransferase involved in cell wall biosynthesis
MKEVVLVCCGRFHYQNYVNVLEDHGILKQVIYSHRKGTILAGGTGAKNINLYLKEYLYQGHLRILGYSGLHAMAKLYHGIWEWQLLRAMEPSSLLHVMLHGNCSRAIRRFREASGKVMGEAVNSHPRNYYNTIEKERELLGIKRRYMTLEDVRRAEEEISCTTHILSPSKFVSDSYRKAGTAPELIYTLPFGANISEFRPLVKEVARPKERIGFRAVCVAQVSVRKGHQYLLRAWKELSLPDAELHCYGIVEKEVYQALLRIGARNVIFHGPIGKKAVISALQEADVFILPTVEEGFAVAILEAMACGVPILTTSASGADGVITHGVEGFIVPPSDSKTLAVHLEMLYKSKELRLEMGVSGRDLTVSRQSWKRYAENLIEIYKKILHNDDV